MKRSHSSINSEQDYSIPPVFNGTSTNGIIRVPRDLPPAHYTFKINSFSLFAEEKSIDKYESGVFEAGGYKWRLLLYPNGNTKSNGDGCISLYLQIDETETLPLGWQINVNLKLFVLDQIRDKYLTIEDAGAVKRFHQMRTEWGFDQFLRLEYFKDASKGYLVNDCCVFGVEVFVIEQKGNWECLSMIKQPAGNPIAFKLSDFSTLDGKCYESPLQSIAGFKWKLMVYPKGDNRAKSSALSLFLYLEEAPGVPPGRSLCVKYKLRVLDQINSNHKEFSGVNWFRAKKLEDSWGLSEFTSLEDLRNASKGFLVGDALTVEAEIVLVSTVKCAS